MQALANRNIANRCQGGDQGGLNIPVGIIQVDEKRLHGRGIATPTQSQRAERAHGGFLVIQIPHQGPIEP